MTTASPTTAHVDTDASTRPRLIDIARSFEPGLRAAESTIETERRVPDEIIAELYDTGIFRAFMPKELGGLEAHPLEWLEAVEELSRVNGSVGWLCMLHTGTSFAKASVMQRILENERWITAGNVGRAAGKAVKVDGGYRISGRWPFCSGSPEATYLFGRSVLHDENDEPVTHPVDQLPWYIHGYFPAKDVTLHDTWDGLGLRGTGSGDIEVTDLFVPTEMVNEMGIWERPYDRALYRGNFHLMAHAAHAIGLAQAALDEFITISNRAARRGSHRQRRLGKEQVHQIAAARADASIKAARLFMQDTVRRAYDDAQHNTHIDYELRVQLHEANLFAVETAQNAVRGLFEQAGTATVFKGQLLERIHRDITTASQHILVSTSSYDRIGQYLLTRDLEDGPEIDVEGGFILAPHPHKLRDFAATQSSEATERG